MEDFEKSKDKIYLSRILSDNNLSEYNSIDLLFTQISGLTEDSYIQNDPIQNYTEPAQKQLQQKLIIQHTNNWSKINNTYSISNNSVNILNVSTRSTVSNRKSQSVTSRKDKHKRTNKIFDNEIKYRYSKLKKKVDGQVRN